MKKMIKIFVMVFLAGIIVESNVNAKSIKSESNMNVNTIKVENLNKELNITKAEQVVWKYRYHNGELQRRLWSYTYGYWKTPWINVN